MPDVLPKWSRPRFEHGGQNAVLLYALYGRFAALGETVQVVNPADYRTAGLPPEFEVRRLKAEPGKPLPFLGGEMAKVLLEDNPALFERAEEAGECLLLKGEFVDPPDLNYLRDTIGMITWFFDHGAVAAVDPQRIRLYGAVEWWEEMFVPDLPRYGHHVVILSSVEEPGHRWLHTRGLRKFGRPDISIRRVAPEHERGAIELINRLIQLQAEGGRVPEGQVIKMRSLPPGLSCHHLGNFDDPDFNNVHIEIRPTREYSF